MIKEWSRNFKKCNNCGTIRFVHEAKGYCCRCYTLVKRLENIKLWNLDKPETLKGYPSDMIVRKIKYFKNIKLGFEEQIRGRLSDLKLFEQALNDKISGIDIVPRFQKIAKLAGSKDKDFLWHQENLFDHNFTVKQKKIIFKILGDITETIPWKGINYNKINFCGK